MKAGAMGYQSTKQKLSGILFIVISAVSFGVMPVLARVAYDAQADLTFFAGLKRIGPTTASTLSTFEPIVAVA